MIELYSGTVGSGKSLHAASDIRFALTRKHPRPVMANFPLGDNAPIPEENKRLYTYVPNAEMSAGVIIDWATDWWDDTNHIFGEDKLILCLDECSIIFNSRRWSDAKRYAYLEFLSQSRKYGVHVILIAQNAKMIDNQFRMLIDVEHNHRKISNMGPIGWLVGLPFGGALSLDVRYLFQANERLGMELRIPHRKDFAMYDSYARFERQEV